MFAGSLFSSGDPGLDAHVRTLDDQVALLFPEFVDGRAAALLRLVPDEFTGRGVALAAGFRPPAGTALALYYGHVVAGWSTGEFVPGLPTFRVDGRTWHPSIDAAAVCRMPNPPACNAALFNHKCHDATVVLRQAAELRGCALSCIAAYPTAALQPGGRLLWDYDGGARRGNSGFSVDLAHSLELRAAGVDSVPCACRGALPCPRSRWFSIFPGGAD
jgi:hypothetical protein